MQVYQHIDQGIVIGDGSAIAQLGAFNTQGYGLAVDALGSGALFVDPLVDLAVAVELITNARPHAGGHSGHTATFGPVLVIDRASVGDGFREAEGTSVAAALMLEAGSATIEGELERHR